MSRLTDRCWRNLDPWECCGQNFHCSRKLNDDGGCINGCIVPKLYKHLAEYEDLEEQGLLLKLPCPLGTEVYKVREVYYCDFNYDDEVCTRYCKYKCEEGLYCEHQIIKYGISKVLFTINMYNEFNKTIFLTKEEAEKALERLECAE